MVSYRFTVRAAAPREFHRLQFERVGVAASPSYCRRPVDCEARLWVLAFVGAFLAVICYQQLIDALSFYQRVRSRNFSRSSSTSRSSSSTTTGLSGGSLGDCTLSRRRADDACAVVVYGRCAYTQYSGICFVLYFPAYFQCIAF